MIEVGRPQVKCVNRLHYLYLPIGTRLKLAGEFRWGKMRTRPTRGIDV